jgi:hypothetical protein
LIDVSNSFRSNFNAEISSIYRPVEGKAFQIETKLHKLGGVWQQRQGKSIEAIREFVDLLVASFTGYGSN